VVVPGLSEEGTMRWARCGVVAVRRHEQANERSVCSMQCTCSGAEIVNFIRRGDLASEAEYSQRNIACTHQAILLQVFPSGQEVWDVIESGPAV
jgi:hypothetical protein